MNVFAEAGSRLFNDYEKYGEKRTAAIEELEVIQKICEMGVYHFYKSITNGGKPDVKVTREHENLITIEYGFRQCGYGTVRKGPKAAVLVTPQGETVAAKNSRWLPEEDRDGAFEGRTISREERDSQISQWLIEYMEEAEEEYRRLSN